MKLALAVVALVVVLAAIAIAVAGRLNRRAFLADAAAAIAASPPQPRAAISEADLAALPPPVADHLRAAGVVGKRRVDVARLHHGGRFRTSGKGSWSTIEGDYVITTGAPAFLWWGRIGMAPLVDVVARDGFALGRGRMLVKVLGAIPVADARGPDMDQAGFDRLLAELTLVPTALLPGPHLRWEPVDARSARAFLSLGDLRASLVFSRDPATGETLLEMERGHDEGGKIVRRKFLARSSGPALAADGFRLHRRIQGTWRLPGGDLDYVDFELEDARFE